MPDASKLNDWLQVVGMFGLIGSLIFVGLQIRQDHEIALSSTYQARSDATVESANAAINSPAFLNAAAKLYANRPEDLTMQEAVAWEFHIGADMTAIESNHQQYLLGYLSEEHWQRNMRELACMLEQPLTRQMVSSWEFRESFEKLVGEIMERAIRSPTGCWVLDYPYPVSE